MRKLLAVLSIFAIALFGITEIQASTVVDQARCTSDATRFLGGMFGATPTNNDRDIMANAICYAWRQGTRLDFYDVDFEQVLGAVIYPLATQLQIDHEKDYLTTFYQLGQAFYYRNIEPTVEVEVGLSNPSVQALVSQAGFTAYAAGFSDGQTQNTGSAVNALASFVPQLLGVGFGFFLQIASFEVLGVSLLSIVAMMVGLTGLLITLKVATGGR